MKKHVREKDIEKACKDWARRRGWWVRKFVSPSNRSVPDDIFAKDGVVAFVEFKKPGGKLTPLQEEEHKLMRAAGLDVYVFDNVTDFQMMIENLEWLV